VLPHANTIAHVQSTRQRYHRNGDSPTHTFTEKGVCPNGSLVRDRQCDTLQVEDGRAMGVSAHDLAVLPKGLELAIGLPSLSQMVPFGDISGLLDRHFKRYRDMFDLSSVDLDGSHTPAIRGGEAVEYQGRKKGRTTNALFLTDRQGLPLAMSEPVSGNHNDLFDIEVQFEVVTATLDRADIKTQGLFLNADAGFDSKDFRSACARRDINANICFNKRNGSVDDRDEYFDQGLYDQRYAVERTNAWIDSFRSLLNRFDTTIEWTCNKKVDNQIRVMPLIFGYTFRFQIPLSFYSAMSSVSSFYCTRSLSTGISIVRLLTLA